MFLYVLLSADDSANRNKHALTTDHTSFWAEGAAITSAEM